jgi:HKD family nuclease
MNDEIYFLYDEKEDTQTRFVSFTGKSNRFDLAITTTNRFYGKKLVFNIQSGITAIVGSDDLEQEGYLEYAFKLNEEEAEDLLDFLQQVI